MAYLTHAAIGDAAYWLAAVVSITGSVWLIGRRVLRFWKNTVRPTIHRFDRALIVLNGREAVTLPENGRMVSPAIAGILERVETVETSITCMRSAVDEIRDEVTPNGGGSIKDSVNRMEERLRRGDERFDRIEHHLKIAATKRGGPK